MYYLIAYDIANPKRLSKVAKILSDYAIRIQFSIFEAELSAARFNELKNKLEQIIDKDEDGIKYFHICEPCFHKRQALGKALPFNLNEDFIVF